MLRQALGLDSTSPDDKPTEEGDADADDEGRGECEPCCFHVAAAGGGFEGGGREGERRALFQPPLRASRRIHLSPLDFAHSFSSSSQSYITAIITITTTSSSGELWHDLVSIRLNRAWSS